VSAADRGVAELDQVGLTSSAARDSEKVVKPRRSTTALRED
jgi:hypothetical protein